jgi:glycosyltransferase involved in cell wall biosynthesis
VRILILHQHFYTPYTGGAIRSYYLAKALLEKGMTPVIISGYSGIKYKKELIDGIEVHYLPVAYNNRFGFYKRGVAFIRYALGAARLVNRLQPIDATYAISVPLTVGLAAIWIKNRYKIPFIFEVGDLWPDAPVQLGFVKNPILQRSLYRLEKRIYGKASLIVALSPMIQKAIQEKAPSKPVVMIPNMSDTNYYSPVSKPVQTEFKYGVSGKFVVSYLGALGYANGLEYFLECARFSQKADLPVQFIVCGEGGMKANLNSAAKQLQLKNLTFLPMQSREGVKEILSITDAAFICYRQESILETGSPNKYFDGLAAGKLILINFNGWIKDEIEREQCGVALKPDQPAEFVAKIKPFLSDKELLDRYRNNARVLAERSYSRTDLSERFVNLFRLKF